MNENDYKTFEELTPREQDERRFRWGWTDVTYAQCRAVPVAEHPAYRAGYEAATKALHAALLKFSVEWSFARPANMRHDKEE